MDVTIGMRLALAAAHTCEDKLRTAQARLRAIIDETEREPLVERVHGNLEALWDPVCGIDMANAGHWLHGLYETQIAPWLDRNELAFRVVSRADAEGTAGSEDLDDDHLGIMVVASRDAEMRAEALRALVQDAADRLTAEKRVALERFLHDPLGAEAFEAAKSMLDEIEVFDPEPPFPGLRDEA